MPLLDHDTLQQLTDLAIEAGLFGDDTRTLLLNALPRRFVASLRRDGVPAQQLALDLQALNRVERLGSGEVPLRRWLEVAVGIAQTAAPEVRLGLLAMHDRILRQEESAPRHLRDHVVCLRGCDAYGEVTRGTAFFIGARTLLTAAHVVLRDRHAEGEPEPLQLRLTTPDGGEHDATLERWHAQQDWAVVTATCDGAPLQTRALTASPGTAWTSFGFPRLWPTGLAMRGTTLERGARVDGCEVLQLHTPVGSAPLQGLSGAPVVVDGAAVGVFRTTIQGSDGHTVGGTLFACPIEAIDGLPRTA